MKDFYPYTIIPQAVEKIRLEGIPVPKLPKLMPMPESVKRKYLGTVIFVLSLTAFIIFNVIKNKSFPYLSYLSFFVAIISLVAMIFEFVQYGKLKKQFEHDLKMYNEHKEAYKKIKAKQDKIETENKDENRVKNYQLEKIKEFFNGSFNAINAVPNEYSPAKKRFKLFLDEYFPDEVLDNVRIQQDTKKIDYVPDFVIQFARPKLNVAIEVEEPYSLSNVPENIQKDYDAKDRLRQRFANELGWIVIVLSEEQAVVSPTECCKFIEESIEIIYDDIKSGDQFVNIKPIKKQKMLTGEERAHLKKSKYRETYLIHAGLMDGPIGYPVKDKKFELFGEDNSEDEKLNTNEEEVKEEQISKIDGSEKNDEVKVDEVTTEEETEKIEEEQEKIPVLIAEDEKNKTQSSKIINNMKTPLEKKREIENEQMMLIKKIADKVKTVSDDNGTVKNEQKPIKYTIEEDKKVEKKEEHIDDDVSQKGKQLKREEDILKDLYHALDKHSKRQKEMKEEKELSKEENEEKIEIEEKKEIQKEVKIELENSSKSAEDEPVKEEKKEMTAAEMILAKKRQLEKSMVLAKAEEKKIETKKVEKVLDTQEEQDISDEPEKEEVIEVVENKVEKKKELSEEAKKNQELIDSYREKIEGAVFDKNWDELMDFCNQAIKEIPYWDWAYYRRSTAWGSKKEFDKVIQDCNKAIGFNPTLADAYYNRGTARYFNGRYMDASEDYQKAIDLNYFKKADAHFNKGLCYQKLEHEKKAYHEFLIAKEMGSAKAAELVKNLYNK